MEEHRIKSKMQILHLEHEDQTATRIHTIIKNVWNQSTIDQVTSLTEFQQSIQQHHYDLILTNHHPPQYDARQLVQFVKQLDSEIPVILVTDLVSDLVSDVLDNQAAEEPLINGVHDIVTISDLYRLIPAIKQTLYIRELKKEIQKERAAKFAGKRLFNQVIDLIPHYIFAKDKDGRILFLNQASANAYGLEPAQAIGKREIEISNNQQEALRFLDENQEIIKQDQCHFNPNSTYTDSSGTIHYQHTYKIPFVPEGMNEKAVLGIAIDISAIKRTEQRLKHTNAIYTSLVENIPQLLIRKDVNGVITHVNQTACKIFGKPHDELVGKTDFELFPHELAEKFVCDDKRLIETREIIDVTEENIDAQGNKIYVHTTKTPILDENNNLLGLQIISWDVTKQLENEEKIKNNEIFIRAILDSLSSNIAIIDEEGTIIHVNQAWKDFAVQNGITNIEQLNYFIGLSYLELCQIVADSNVEESEDARAVLVGIREVLSGNHDYFYYQYPCHSPTENRWFNIKTTHLQHGSVNQVVISHDNITEQKMYEIELKERTLAAELGYTISSNITGSKEMQPMLQSCAELLVQHLDAAFARIWTINEEEQVLELKASAGMYTHLNGDHGRVPIGKFKIGLIAQERKPHLTNSVVGDPRVGNQEWAKQEGMVAFAGYPIILEDRLFGVMAIFAKHTLSEVVLNMMQSVANVIALGMNRIITYEQLMEEQKIRNLESIQRTKLEMSVHSQTQKMDAVKQLASGIAHDFNNFHWIIKSNTQFLMDNINPDSDMYNDANEILTTVDRASVLTKELTLLSKKQILEPKPVNINQEILSLSHSFEQITDTKIKIHTLLQPDVHVINIDPSELEQVMLIIVVNACEAMPLGGELHISTSNVDFNENNLIQHKPISIDTFVCLSVKDTGTGMDEETQSKMFDPFFTTKVAGKGTGLGLSIAHNIMDQIDGFIHVNSKPETGTEIKLYFPAEQPKMDSQ